MARREWTPAEDRILHRYAGKESQGLIAERLDRTCASVRMRMRRLGLTCGFAGKCRNGKRYWTQAEKFRALKMAARYEMGEIGERLGRNASSVHHMLWRELDGNTNLRSRRTYITPAEAARLLDISPGTIYRFAWRLWPRRRGSRLKLRPLDLIEMARWMLDYAPPRTQANLRVTANHLRRVISELNAEEDNDGK